MSEILFFIASIAAAVVLTAVAVMRPTASPFWQCMLWGGSAVFFACACVLLVSYLTASGPDVVMRLTYPRRPALLLQNTSNVVAKQIKYAVALININGPDAGKPVQIPIAVFDFINGHQVGGPEDLFTPPQIVRTPDKGQKMFGWIQISCPDCIKIHYYWAYIDFGYGGWYSEVSKDRHEAIAKWLRENGPYTGTEADVSKVLSVIPVKDRVEIKGG